MKKIFLFIASAVFFIHVSAQTGGASINDSGAAPDPSAILDVSSTTQGTLIPRMTTAQRNAIAAPADGLQIFNTTTNCLNIRIGETWKQVCGDCDFNSPVAGNNGPICEGSTLSLSATSISGATYQWSGPNGFSSTLQNPAIPNASQAASGTYSVSATLNGCTSQLQNTVATVNSTPVTPTAGNDGPVCTGSGLALTAVTIIGATYSWTGPNGYSANVQNPVLSNAQINNAGVYNVTATVNGCLSASGNTTVTINAIPATPGAISGAATACANSVGNVYSIVPVSGATSYNWNAPGGATITANSGTSVTITFGPSPAGNITVSATNICGTSALSSLAVGTNLICSPYTFEAMGSGRIGTIQNFTVPAGVTQLTIEARGAQGANGGGGSSAGGKGARIIGTCTVIPGDVLKILVGQQGTPGPSAYTGGGGGTFVATSSNAPLVIAGGGGGGNGGTNIIGSDGQATESGASSSGGIAGGSGGNGGSGGQGGGGGGGFYTDGATGSTCNNNGGSSFLSGGLGAAPTAPGNSGEGGFGGGGSGDGQCCGMGGAGGGYSGGGGGKSSCGQGVGGGGGSFNSGTNQTNTSGFQSGNGQVILIW